MLRCQRVAPAVIQAAISNSSGIKCFSALDPEKPQPREDDSTDINAFPNRVLFDKAWTSYEWDAFHYVDVWDTIRDHTRRVWHVWGNTGASHYACLDFKLRLSHQSTQPIKIELMNFTTEAPVNIGCFQVSVSDDPYAIEKMRLIQPPHPQRNDPWFHLGCLYSFEEKWEMAMAAFLTSIAKLKSHSEATELIDKLERMPEVFARLCTSPAENRFFCTVMAQRLIAKGATKEATTFLDTVRHDLESQMDKKSIHRSGERTCCFAT